MRVDDGVWYTLGLQQVVNVNVNSNKNDLFY